MDQKYNDDTLRYVIAPFSEILSSIDGKKQDTGPSPVTRGLYELEGLLSSIIDSHHHSNKHMKGSEKGELPSYEEIYKEGTTVALPIQTLSPEAPTLKRKPHGLHQHLTATEEKSSREKALEALMRLSTGALVEKRPRSQQISPGETELGAARRRAMENLAERGWDMRQVIPRGGTKTRKLEEEG